MSVDIVAENAQASTYALSDMQPGAGPGDLSVAGFARSISVNVGGTIQFCVDGPATTIRIFRVGYYADGKGFREVDQITNTPTTQPEPLTIPNSNGATTATNWAVTAEWTVPGDAVSGMYMAYIPNAAGTNAFEPTFVVRDDDAEVDIVYKTSDTTWGAAYNYYGTKTNPNGKNLYGVGVGVGAITERSYAVSYHRPVITRGSVTQTYWWACELPLIRFLERNGFSVKYVTSDDLDREGAALLQKGKVFLSSGHDEYWTQPMWDAVVDYRDNHGGRSIFMSGNEVFWRARFERNGDESVLWCYKDSMPGPGGHVAGQAFDPVTWTGTWKDTRWPQRSPEWLLTGTSFGMNGVYDYDAVIPKNPYGGLKVWGGSSLVDSDITLVGALGFEADHKHPTQPAESVRILASYTRSAPGGLSDANGENYNVPGNIEWGIVSQRYASGGLTVGFGTCQWSWTLDGTHDRGSTVVSPAAQQFTVNLLRDLGAEPATVTSGVTLQPVNSLDEYGLIPPASVSGTFTSDGRPILTYAKVGGVIIQIGD